MPAQPRTYEGRIRAGLEGRDAPATIILPPLAVRTEALRQAAALTKELVRQVQGSEACMLVMTVPGVGTVTAATDLGHDRRAGALRGVALGGGLCRAYVQAVSVGRGRLRRPHLQTRGPAAAGHALRFGDPPDANSLHCGVKPGRGQALKDWAMAVKQGTSHKKAVVALTRKLAVMMHAIWISGSVFEEREA